MLSPSEQPNYGSPVSTQHPRAATPEQPHTAALGWLWCSNPMITPSNTMKCRIKIRKAVSEGN